MKNIHAKKAVAVYLVITFVLTWTLDFSEILGYDLIPIPDVSMFCPGIAAIITSLIFYRGEMNLGLRLCNFKYALAAVLIPFFYLGASYGLFLLADRSSFSGNILSDDAGYLLMLIPFSLITAAGEEVGWRGFLFPRLTQIYDVNKAAVISGLIWSLWHFPMIIYYTGDTPPLWYQLAIFTGVITLLGVILAYMRLKTNSILPTTILHASHNYFDQLVFGPMTNTYFVNYFAGETGIITLVIVAAIALIIIRRNKSALPKLKHALLEV